MAEAGCRPGRRRSPHPTISDVAREASVSKGTVSNVLNNRVAVSDAVRARVEQAIARLGFRPAESARSLTARKLPTELDRGVAPTVPRLTTVGYVSVDFTAQLDRLPRREERRLAHEIIKTIGGPAANVAAVAANLGEPYAVAASLITAIGVDQDSDWAASELSRRRVDVVVAPERRTGRLNRAIVLVEKDGRRTIVNEPSCLGGVDVERFLDEVDPAGLCWCLHVEGYQLPAQSAMVARARARGFLTSMQATGLPPEWMAAHRDMIFGGFDVVMLHRESLDHLGLAECGAEEGLESLAELARSGAFGSQITLVTLGREGAAAISREGVVRAPALPVAVVDTTGAGDSFIGAFLAAWLNGTPVDTALRLACVAGSLQVTRFGAQEILPDAPTLHRLAGIPLRAPAGLPLA